MIFPIWRPDYVNSDAGSKAQYYDYNNTVTAFKVMLLTLAVLFSLYWELVAIT
jgi:hypothetical protein